MITWPQALAALLALGICLLYLALRQRSIPHLPKPWLLLGFGLKCLAGWALGHYYYGVALADTWYYHESALAEYDLLLHHPGRFLVKDIFTHGYNHSVFTHFLDSGNSFFNDLQQNLLIKLLAIFNLISGGNYWVNVVLYNALFFSGWLALYRFCTQAVGIGTYGAALLLFCYPPLLWWGSGILKDGWCIALTGHLLYGVHRMAGKAAKPRAWLGWVAMLILLFLLRPFWAMLLGPLALLYLATHRYAWRPVLVFPGAVLLGYVLYLCSSLLPPAVQLTQKLANRRAEFALLHTQTPLPPLAIDGRAITHIQASIPALGHALLQPLKPLSGQGFLHWGALVLVYLSAALWVLALYALWRRRQRWGAAHHLLFWLALANLLVIGLTVPNLGAIVRYKALYETLILLLAVDAIFPKPAAAAG